MVVSKIADKVDPKKSINGHSTITIGWLLDSLRENDKCYQKLHGNRIVKKVEASDVSGGKGFASEILRCIISFEDSVDDARDVYTTILKVPGFESLKEASIKSGGDCSWMENGDILENLNCVHEFECNFYANLAPIFDIPVPKVYKTLPKLSGSDGCLHMEDLTLRGRTLSIFDYISMTQLKHIVRLLAHMHKNILSAKPEVWKGKFLKNQTSLVAIIDMMKPMNESFEKKCKALETFKPLLDRCQKIATSKEFYLYVTTEAYKTLPSVIVHGDLHPGNMMWEIDENGDVQNRMAAFVDWQTIHEGSPMSDLARVLALCCDGTTRRQAESFIFDFYLECLTSEFGGDSSKIPYTKEDLKKAYSLAFLLQAFMTPGGTAFLDASFAADKDEPQSLKESRWEQAELRALHALQDSDRLLQTDFKDLYEKYGV